MEYNYNPKNPRHKLKRFLLTQYGDGRAVKCFSCRTILTWETLTIDRIVPGALGGRYDRKNIRAACRECNEREGHLLSKRITGGEFHDRQPAPRKRKHGGTKVYTEREGEVRAQ